MKFTDAISNFIKKKDDGKEYFFSLYIDVDAAAVAVWSVGQGMPAKIASFAHGAVASDSWEARIQVIDRLLSAAEEKVGSATQITKTVFGMPGTYLTPEGNIADDVRPHLKRLTQMLELKPVGFVPLSQALAYQLKNDDGVPPSIILVGCSGKSAHVTLFRIGKVTSDEAVELADDPALVVEHVLKKHQDGDVLPSRILLYGGSVTHLEEVRAKLLKHPWPSRTNFLHFPKIEIVSIESLLAAVSLAGSSELAADMGEEEVGSVSTVVAQSRPSAIPPTGTQTEQVVNAVIAGETELEAMDEMTEESEEEPEDVPSESVVSGEDELEQEAETIGEAIEQHEGDEDVANVEMVTPESLGFRKEDVLEKSSAHIPPSTAVKSVSRKDLEEAVYDEKEGPTSTPKKKFTLPFKVPHISFAWLSSVGRIFSRIPLPKGKGLPLVVVVVIIIAVAGFLWYILPKATVTVLVLPQTVEQSTTLTVNPTATVADPASKIIPGHTQTKSVSGEKTAAVTGKKSIGDPAKGTVTIYNKITSGKTFTKGTVLTASSISFTLDSDVSVASASESLSGDTLTFGKVDAAVTAKDIGPNGNIPAGTELTFATVSNSQVSAKNGSAFTGGTSKQVTVVSRADQDALVKALTDDLVGQAKSQLLESNTGGERLIDQTIKTAVSDKSFDQEVDQQVSQLHGKITISVTGISINDEDVKAILTSLVEGKVPSGYALAPEQTNVKISNVTVKKDGSITLTASLQAVALPKIDTQSLQAQLVGKDVNTALSLLKQTQGVSGAEFRFSWSPTTSRLPAYKKNITITTMVQQ